MSATGQSRPRPGVEVSVLVAAVATFVALHAAAGRDHAAATAHALALQAVERQLGVAVEGPVNAWLVGGPAAVAVTAVYIYRSYYLVVVGVLAWVAIRHPEVYVNVRRVLVAMLLLVLPVYWAVPMSPPRFAQAGIVDVVAAHDPFALHGAVGGNSWSAMPSLHVGLSAWCAYAGWSALRRAKPRLALLVWAFPLLMTAVVLGTGNHYVLDVVGSALLLAASVAAATAWGRLVRRE